MPNVYGVEFNANQSELVKEVVRELLKDRNCTVYAVPHLPQGELQMLGWTVGISEITEGTPLGYRPGKRMRGFKRI